MAKSYTLARVKQFIQRIQEMQEQVQRLIDRGNGLATKPDRVEYFQGRFDLAEDVLQIAEKHFGAGVREGKE